jgi:hypothetical protein
MLDFRLSIFAFHFCHPPTCFDYACRQKAFAHPDAGG